MRETALKTIYIVTIESPDDDTNRHQVMRDVATHILDVMTARNGGFGIEVSVTDHEGNIVGGDYYEPEEFS